MDTNRKEPISDLILEHQRVAYVLTDRDLRILERGGAHQTQYALSLHETSTTSLLDAVPELLGCEAVLADVISGNMPKFLIEYINRVMPDGREGFLTVIALPYHRADSAAVLLVTITDMSEQGQYAQLLAQQRNELRLLQQTLASRNRELAVANADLRRINQMKSSFLSIATHELRGPLTPINSYLIMLLDGSLGPLSKEQSEVLHLMRQSVMRLNAVANELLDAAQLEAARFELTLGPIDLSEVVSLATIEYQPQFEASVQQFTSSVSPDLPPVLGDEIRLIQIISNLISNAHKYTPRGGNIDLKVGRAANERFVQVLVTDNGIGVPVEDQPRLFDPFFRARNAKRVDVHGTGLGLYITRALVELHGGRIWFESDLGKGSRFYLLLPIAEHVRE